MRYLFWKRCSAMELWWVHVFQSASLKSSWLIYRYPMINKDISMLHCLAICPGYYPTMHHVVWCRRLGCNHSQEVVYSDVILKCLVFVWSIACLNRRLAVPRVSFSTRPHNGSQHSFHSQSQLICWVQVSILLQKCNVDASYRVQGYWHIGSGWSNAMSLQLTLRKKYPYYTCLWMPLFCTLWRHAHRSSLSCTQAVECMLWQTW